MSEQVKLIIKSSRDHFSQVPRPLLEDKRLSWKAKGIISYLLGKPSDWVVRVGDLLSQSIDGTDSCRSGLKELCEHGYARWEILRNEDGTIASRVLVVSDQPTENPSTGETPREVFPEATNNYSVHRKKIIFAKPTESEAHAYAKEIGFMEPDMFMAHYESCGWKVGRRPMVDWKAAMRGWKARSSKLSIWEIKQKIEAITERLKSHPCNRQSVYASLNPTPAQKAEYVHLCTTLDDLKLKLAS